LQCRERPLPRLGGVGPEAPIGEIVHERNTHERNTSVRGAAGPGCPGAARDSVAAMVAERGTRIPCDDPICVWVCGYVGVRTGWAGMGRVPADCVAGGGRARNADSAQRPSTRMCGPTAGMARDGVADGGGGTPNSESTQRPYAGYAVRPAGDATRKARIPQIVPEPCATVFRILALLFIPWLACRARLAFHQARNRR